MAQDKLKLMRKGLILLSIFILALTVRIIYFYQINSTPLLGLFPADSYHYHKFALEILKGNCLYKETVYLNPLYPFFVALIYGIFRGSLAIVAFSQVVLDSITCVLLYLLCIKVFNKKSIGILASLIYSFYGLSIFYTGFLLDTTLVTFLNVGLVLLLLHAKDTNKSMLWFVSGIVIGLNMLLKATILLFLPFLIPWLLHVGKRKSKIKKGLVNIALIFIGLLIIAAPFSLRNYMVEKRFWPFPVHGGINFYRGNNPDATGTYASGDLSLSMPIVETKNALFRARKETGKNLNPSQASNYWFLKGLQFIRENPGQYLLLTFRKLLLFWNAEEIYMNTGYDFCKKFIPILNLPLFSFGIMAPFAIIGFILAIKKRLSNAYLIIAFIIVYTLSATIFYIAARFRFPAVPFIIMLGSYALTSFMLLLKELKWKKVTFFSLMLIASFFIVHIDITPRFLDFRFTEGQDFVNLGNVYTQKDMLDEAIVAYKKALNINPRSALVSANLAYVYAKKDMFDEAISEYKKAISLNPDSAESYVNMGNVYFEKGMLDEAFSEYKKALSIEPDLVKAHYNLGIFYFEKDMFDEAIAEYKKAIEIEPYNEEAHCNMGDAYSARGQLDEAIAEYKKTLAINPNLEEAHINLGSAYFKKGILDAAIVEYKYALRINTNNAKVRILLGSIYFKKDMLDEAITEYKKAIEINPNLAQTHIILGSVYAKKGMLNKAIAEYQKAVNINPSSADIYFKVGNIYNAEGKLDGAITLYQKFLVLKPDSPGVHNNLGNAYFKKGMLDEAIAEYKKAIEINPNWTEAYNNLGYTYFINNMPEKAIVELKNAIKIDPDYAKPYYNLAMVYYAKKDFKQAIYYINKAKELGYPVKPELLEELTKYD